MKYLLTLIAVMFLLCSCSEEPKTSISKDKSKIVETCKDLQVFTVELDGKEKVTHAIPPDVPIFGAWGKDTYSFKGKIKFDNIEKNFNSQHYFPLCVIKYKELYYLILCDYFTLDDYYVYAFEEGDWQLKALSELPESIGSINLPDKYYSKSFKMRYIESVLEKEGVEHVLNLLGNYLNENPRMFWVKFNTDYDNTPPKDLKKLMRKTVYISDMMDKIYSKVEGNEEFLKQFLQIVIQMFQSSCPEDRHDEILGLIGIIGNCSNESLAYDIGIKHVNEEFIDKVSNDKDKEYLKNYLKRYYEKYIKTIEN